MSRGPRYAGYVNQIDLDAFEEAIGFEPIKHGVNKHGEPEDIGHCPDPWGLHKNGDTTGKFAINRQKRLYGCFVCGGGTLLDLTSAVKRMTDQQAEEWLYQFTTPATVTNREFIDEIDELLAEHERGQEVMPYYNERVLEPWTAEIGRLEGWLADRGISPEVAIRARLGFQADAMRLAPQKSGRRLQEPYTGPCVYFPHYWGERLVGWQQRWLDEDRPSWIPKYTNTSGFPKTETIYNYEQVYLAQRPIIVCESVPTVLFLESLGYPAVALFGSSVTEEQMRLLRLCQQGLVLAPDNDGPGRKWTSYTEEEKLYGRERVLLADYLARHVLLRVMEPVGEYDSGNDLGDLLDGGPRFAAAAVKLLYEDAEYYG